MHAGNANAQTASDERTIRGVVINDSGLPLAGVIVTVEGTSRVTITDPEGNYSVKAKNNDLLIFSLLSYSSQDIRVGIQQVINVTLQENAEAIGEVVVVGFGSQKKESLVSSIATISPKELKGPTSNLTNTISGRIAGMISYQRSGEPGQDNASFFVRGIGSFGSGKIDPLILIDGVESSSTDLARMQPDDIESFSVLKDAAAAAGASKVDLLDEPMAAAIGAGLPVSEASGSMVVDIGGGTTEVGVISLGGMVYKGSVRVGGDEFDEAIINYIRRNYGMLIGEQTAEMVKMKIGSAFPGSEVMEMEVKGRNLAEGVPRSFTISSNEVLEAVTDPINQIVSAIKTALEQTPPEIGADIAERGMVLTGGGSLLRDLDCLLSEETGLPVFVAEDPLECVVRGCGMALEKHMDKIFSG